ncbi:MAG TPA: Maf family protein [Candidatus Polarisedimenticolia bacterium]|jgi:septum formation protein|nr:Maf family protein [Candidatus Polarisedimenticolia bacterium]
MSRRLILASASPRRADLLGMIGLEFATRPTGVDETPQPGEPAPDLALRLARTKVLAADASPGPSLVVAADTLVVLDGEVLNKPVDRDEAARFLARLAGRRHEVMTGLAVRTHPEEEVATDLTVSRVTFTPMSREEIAWYAASGEGLDKAGAYALQGIGSIFVAGVEGSYTNVIGLPMERLYPHLRRHGLLAISPTNS